MFERFHYYVPYIISHSDIVILYKQIIFNRRNNPKTISIELFKFKLREFRQIEYNIAKNKNKLVKHFQKWRNMDDF